MARPKDNKIEKTLRKVVRAATKKGEEITVKGARARAEAELRVEAGFLKSSEWKQKSKETIERAFEEEDDDAEAPVDAKPVQKQGKNTAKGEEQADKTEKTQSKKASTNDKTKSLPAKEEPVQSSSGSESQEDDREDNAGSKPAPAPQKPQQSAPQVNGVKRKADEHDSTTGASSKKEKGKGTRQKAGSPNKKVKKEPSSSEESSQEDPDGKLNEDSTDEGDSDSSTEETSKPQNPQIQLSRPSSNPGTIQSIPSQAFEPPSGYAPLADTSNPTINAASLAGKQIWHLTAPSNVPLSALKNLDPACLTNQTPLLTHENTPYILTEPPYPSSEVPSLFFPSADGYTPLPSDIRVHKSLALQQQIVLPNLSAKQASRVTGSGAAADVGEAPVSSARPQPKGLRMRYGPLGHESEEVGDLAWGSDGEDSRDADGRQFPHTLGQHDPIQGRGGNDAAGVSGKEGKKSKKSKKDKGVRKDEAATNAVSMADVPPAAEAATATSVIGDIKAEWDKTEASEKAKAKEEKKRKKESKRKEKAAS